MDVVCVAFIYFVSCHLFNLPEIENNLILTWYEVALKGGWPTNSSGLVGTAESATLRKGSSMELPSSCTTKRPVLGSIELFSYVIKM